MFLTNTHHATVLFNFGALHSFITSKFVGKHNLPITIMKYTMIVSSVGGEMRTKHICPSISIAIWGGRLFIKPHHHIPPGHRYNSWHGLVILGMDWLRNFDGVILCAKRAIRLTQEDGTTVEFTVAILANQISMLNHVKGTSLDEIRIVWKFLDVF
jgi:hypothetical protein